MGVNRPKIFFFFFLLICARCATKKIDDLYDSCMKRFGLLSSSKETSSREAHSFRYFEERTWKLNRDSVLLVPRHWQRWKGRSVWKQASDVRKEAFLLWGRLDFGEEGEPPEEGHSLLLPDQDVDAMAATASGLCPMLKSSVMNWSKAKIKTLKEHPRIN